MENKTRFSKNYTIKNKDSLSTKLKTQKESEVSIRQHLKESSFSLKGLLEHIKHSNSCVITR